MISQRHKTRLNQILDDLVAELGVPPSRYEDAKSHYEAVGNWLNEDNSELAVYQPTIYPQGSFALGTVVKPLGDDDYDVDVVCRLNNDPNEVTQQWLKESVGDRLKANKAYERMLDPKEGGRRCWTLKYADDSRFHLDILPALQDNPRILISQGIPVKIALHAICITDRMTWDNSDEWPKSNPQGYALWFKDRMSTIFEQKRKELAESVRADVQAIPDYKIQTPLQQVIKLLKRHRDLKYNGDDDKPISIIISTLAAKAYSNQDNIVDAMLAVVPGMRNSIENRDGTWWVPNPVNPHENFADKWNEIPRKRELFLEWLDAVESGHQSIINDFEFKNTGQVLAEAYGYRESESAIHKYTLQTGHKISLLNESPAKNIFAVTHRRAPRWPIIQQYAVSIRARAWRRGWRTLNFANGSAAIPKNHQLRFYASTNVPPPFEVFWQVTNTGEEARLAGQLRGDFYPGQGDKGLEREENTRYKGRHWVECFIVKDARCVAKSGEFVVNIQ